MYCLDAFALLLIVVDLFGTLDDFIAHKAAVGQVLRYYLIVLPEVIVQTVPMALLLGLLFCLANLGKHNEIVALRAGGVSLTRIAVPLLAVSLLAGAIVFVVNVWFVPGARGHSRSLMRAIRGRGTENVIENLFYTNHKAHRDWYARQFNGATGAPLGTVANLGAMGVSGPLNIKFFPGPTPCTETNGDGVVNVTDLLDVILMWGEAGTASDLNDDGIVDVQDLLPCFSGVGCPIHSPFRILPPCCAKDSGIND